MYASESTRAWAPPEFAQEMEEPRALPLRRGVTLAEQLAASSKLRDLLKLRDDGDGDGDGRQLAAAGRRRTLLDVIRDVDDRPPPRSSSGATRRGVSSTTPVAGGATTTASASAAPPAAAAQGERRVSLMALLEQAERQWTTGGGEWKRVEEDAASEEGRKGAGGVGGRCCVCTARGKGAAFIPCGHTFCRACARELRAGRGRCPLCNAAIHEVLNLF